jgi:hypothetical protein
MAGGRPVYPGKMILLFLLLFAGIPLAADSYWLSVCNQVGYTVLGALGVQLLIGYCGQVTWDMRLFGGRRLHQHPADPGISWPKIFLDWVWRILSAFLRLRSRPVYGVFCSDCRQPKSKDFTSS